MKMLTFIYNLIDRYITYIKEEKQYKQYFKLLDVLYKQIYYLSKIKKQFNKKRKKLLDSLIQLDNNSSDAQHTLSCQIDKLDEIIQENSTKIRNIKKQFYTLQSLISTNVAQMVKEHDKQQKIKNAEKTIKKAKNIIVPISIDAQSQINSMLIKIKETQNKQDMKQKLLNDVYKI